MDGTVSIRRADFSDKRVIALLKAHQAFCTNPDSIAPGAETYALSLDALQQPSIHLWTMWKSNGGSEDLVGCAALKILNPTNGNAEQPSGKEGEIKSMHVVGPARGQGASKILMEFLFAQAKAMNLGILYLETGSMEAFLPARRFYERYGFTECGPYADYAQQLNSIYMRKPL